MNLIELLLGRVSSLDIRITDASVSRVHSKVSFINGNFYIKDVDSKFGTLVRQRFPLPIPNKRGFRISLQVTESYMEIGPEYSFWSY